MSRVVKSVAVVDDRRQRPGAREPGIDGKFAGRAVLKNGLMSAYGTNLNLPNRPFTRDAYLDEINRLRIEAEEAGAELRRIRRETEEARAGAEAQREAEKEAFRLETDKSILDDEIFEAKKQELKDLTAEAAAKAAELVESAQSEAEEIRERARAEGYEQGLSGGYEEAIRAFKAEAEPKLGELSEIISSLTSYGPELMREKERELAGLSAAIAGKIIGREIKEDPAFVIDMLREAVQKNHRENYITITLSPDMLPFEAKAAAEVVSRIEGMANNLTVYVEKEAGEGVCLMETPKGVTDMGVSTQLENIRESLLE